MTKAERARELFLEGCNCAQAVFLAFAEDKLDRETALKIASGFGGGMAGMRDVCGAVSGMFMAYGLLCGPADPTDRAAKTNNYAALRQLAGEFEARPSRPNRAPTAITKSARARKWSSAQPTFWKPIWPERQKRRPLKIEGIVMAAANWRTLKKIDAHIHILPDAVHAANPDADDVWMYADLRQYVQIMRWTASSFTRTIPGWHSIPTIIARSSRLHRSGAFPSPFIPIRMRRMICRRRSAS